jgi:hypothetical protein
MGFQHRVGAWICVRVLAEANAAPPWSLPASTTFETIRCEQNQPVDDLLVGTNASGFAYLQCKRSLSLSADAASEFFSVIDQFVRQFLACRGGSTNGSAWPRPADVSRDRFVLVVGPTASGTIRNDLAAVLNQLRGLPTMQPLMEAANNEGETGALSTCNSHVQVVWRKATGAAPTEAEVRAVLQLVYVQTLDVEHDGAAELEAKTILRGHVVAQPATADVAWTNLISLCQDLATRRTGRDRPQLQVRLSDAGIPIVAARSFQNDIARLKDHARQTSSLLADLARIRLGRTEVRINRPAIVELQRCAENAGLIVVGEPGAGKSGSLFSLAEQLAAAQRDVVFLAVDRLAAESLNGLRTELQLEHDLERVLENWPGTSPGFLIIDAIDAARGSPTARVLLDLIRLVQDRAERWHVVASIRKFDLRYSSELQDIFCGSPSDGFLDPEFARIRHINVPALSDEELDQAKAQAPQLRDLFERATPELQLLLRVPFNLRLAAELLGTGMTAGDLSPIRSQLELLERYWTRRVIREDGQGDVREGVLSRVSGTMVSARRLRAERRTVVDAATAASFQDLLSSQVLVEWQSAPGAPVDRNFIAFPHNVLFDYVVARLILPLDHAQLIARVIAEPDLLIAVRPSLSIYFQRLWVQDRPRFWECAFALIEAPTIPEIGKLIGPTVASEMTATANDLQPLYDGLASGRASAELALRHIVGALLPGAR